MVEARSWLLEIIGIIIAVISAILIGFIIILFISDEPLHAITAFLTGPFSNMFNISTIFNKATPLILTGLALCVVFKTNIFSMGAEGQLYVGAFTGSLAAVYISGVPTVLHLILIFFAAIMGGALFAFLPGYFKAKWEANEVVTTLMLNYVAIILTSFLLNKFFKDPTSGGFARMEYFEKSLLLQKISSSLQVHYGFVLAIICAVLVHILLYKTKLGYEMRIVGQNIHFANYGGIKTKRIIVYSVMISGALAGIGGIIEILGVHGTYKDSFSTNLGFDGIIIALLARNNPLAVIIAALFYAYLQVGGQIMQAESDVSRELAVIIQAILVLLVSAQAIFVYLNQRRKLKQNAKLVKSDVV